MKTLIAYASKYGTTKKCAEELAKKLSGETVLVNLKKNPFPDSAGFDRVVIGTSIYIGQMHKEVKAAFASKEAELIKKPFGLFVCCGSPENSDQVLELNVPKTLASAAKTVGFFGGELDFSRIKGFDKFIAKMVAGSAAKQGKEMPKLDFSKIDAFAKEFEAN